MEKCNNFRVDGKNAYVVKEKFKLMWKELKFWNKGVFGWLDLGIENAVNDLNELDDNAADGAH